MPSSGGWPFSPQIPFGYGGILTTELGDIISGEIETAVYANGAMSVRFSIPTSEDSIDVSLFVQQVGSPAASLTVALYSDSSGSPDSLLATSSLSPSQVSSGSPNWTPFITFTPTSPPLAAGYYWVVITSPSSTPSSYYWSFMNLGPSQWQDIGARTTYTPPTGWTGPIATSGSSIIWVRDSNGNNLTILPYGRSQSGGSTVFDATSSYQVTCIIPWVSDMSYVPISLGGPEGYNATWAVVDNTTGQTLGRGTSSQYYNSHGLSGLIPIQLDHPVNIIAGHQYQINLSDPGDQYNVILRGSVVNPPIGSLTGQSSYIYAELGLADFSAYRVLDYPGNHILTQGNSGGIGGRAQVGVRFIPAQAEILESVSLRMYDGNGTPGNYPSGWALTAALYASNEKASTTAGATPIGSPLSSATTDSGDVPYNGFFTISGFSYSLDADTPYWIVWSASSAPTNEYVPLRCVSPFRNLVQVSDNGGTDWVYPGQGPSDIAWHAATSVAVEGSPFDQATASLIDTGTNLVAQPFSLSQSASVTSIFTYSNGNVQTTIYPDNGSGAPDMTRPLGTGSFNSAYQYIYTGVIVPLANPVWVTANTKYWIVFSATSGTGTIAVAQYWSRPTDPSVPSGYDTLVSTSSGSAWTSSVRSPNLAASSIFMVGTVAGSAFVTNTLERHGISNKGFVAYGQPFSSGTTIDGQSATEYYKSLGFLEFPWQDGSNGYSSDLGGIVSEYQAVGGGVFGPLYGWGYATQFYNLGNGFMAAIYPDEQEYYLSSGVLLPAVSYGYNGIVIDAPELIAAWQGLYSIINTRVGLSNLLGIAGWLQSDHPVNYGGAQGADGGHNMNTYARYVNSPLALYPQDVNSSGYHNSDSSQCLLWPLRGVSANSTGQTMVSQSGIWPSVTYSGGIIPTVALAMDVSKYHHANQQSSTFGLYCAASNAALEYALLQQVLGANATQAIGRTAMPASVLSLVPQYNNSILELMGEGGSAYLRGAFGGVQANGGSKVVSPYFNWANASDDSSNPGGGFGVATPATTLAFFVDSVPYLSHTPYIEVDTDAENILNQASATSWSHFGPLYNKIQIDGWFGYIQDLVRVLVIDHFYDDATCWSALGLVCHMWGTDSYSTISGWNLLGFKVVVGCPNPSQDPDHAEDIAQLEAYVSAGGNLILYTNGTAPSDLTGIGSTADPIYYNSSQTTYPFLSPYAASDLQAAFSGVSGVVGYLNSYGSGKVLTLTSQFYGDGFGVGDGAGNGNTCDSLSGGLAYLTLNAILWLGGQTPPGIYLPRYVQRTSWAVPLNSNGEGGYSGVGVHVLGTYNGTKSIWLSSDKTSPQAVAINFSSSFYGFPLPWKLTNLDTGTVAQGAGDVALSLDMPSSDWTVLSTEAPIATSTPPQVIFVE